MPFLAAITAAALLHGAVLTANETGHSISVVDTARWTVRTVQLSLAPHNVQVSADGRFAYATALQPVADMPGMDMDSMMNGPGYLLQFDLRNIAAGPAFSVVVGKHPAHVVADSANRYAYVTVSGEDAVKVVDLARHAVAATIPTGKMPHGARLSPDGAMLYVADMDESTVSFIDVAQRREIARVEAGKQPVQVAVSPDGKTVYATLGGENAVAVIDAATRKRRALVNVGPNPAQLYIAPDGRRLYHNDARAGIVRVYDVNADGSVGAWKTFASLAPDGVPDGLKVARDGSVWVADAHGGRVAVFEANGKHRQDIAVPLPMVTSVCFGGDDLHELYIVTGSRGGPHENCGSIFRIRVEVPGLPLPPARVAV